MKLSSILFTLLLVLLLSSCAMQKANLAGKINGNDISYTDFVAAHRGHFNNFMAEKGRTPDAEEKKEILRQTWRNITIHIILKQQFKKHNITVTPQEVIDTLITSVPPYLLSSPMFMVNGKFDRSLYLQSLQFDTPVNLAPVKKHYFEYLVPIQKLKLKLIDDTMLTRRESRLIHETLNSTANIDWLVFDPRDSAVSISDTEVQNYYQENLAKFKIDQFYQLNYCLIPVKPTLEDRNLTVAKVDSLYHSLLRGADFGVLAEKYSIAESAIRGGGLGFVRMADLPDFVANHIADMKSNEISYPLEKNDTWTIYRVSDRTRNMVKLDVIVLSVIPGDDTIASVYPRVESLIELTRSFGIVEASSEMEYELFNTGIMYQDSLWIKDIDVVNEIKTHLGNARKNTVLKPVYSNRLNSWVVAQVDQIQTRKYKSLSEVRSSIIKSLEDEKRLDITKQIAQQWIQRHPRATQSEAAEQGIKVINTPAITYNGILFDKPLADLFYHVLKDHRAKSIKAYVHSDLVLVPIVNRINTTTKAEPKHDQIRDLYMQTLPESWFDNWLENQIRSASIRIWQ